MYRNYLSMTGNSNKCTLNSSVHSNDNLPLRNRSQHICVDLVLVSQVWEMNGFLVPTSFPSHLQARLTLSVSFTRATTRSAIPSQLLCSQQHNTCILPSSRTKTMWAVIPWHFTGWVNAAKPQQRDASQTSSLDWSSTLVYVVKFKGD